MLIIRYNFFIDIELFIIYNFLNAWLNLTVRDFARGTLWLLGRNYRFDGGKPVCVRFLNNTHTWTQLGTKWTERPPWWELRDNIGIFPWKICRRRLSLDSQIYLRKSRKVSVKWNLKYESIHDFEKKIEKRCFFILKFTCTSTHHQHFI